MEAIKDTGDVNDLPSERDMLRHLANQLLDIATALRDNNGRLGRPLEWAESCEYLNTIAERVIGREERYEAKTHLESLGHVHIFEQKR
jgi:Ser/Thr protein kinase RdoA (MazF antagonist)